MTQNKIRAIRIANEYNDMRRIKDNPYVSWQILKGTAPLVEEYLVTFLIDTYISPEEKTDKCEIRIVLPPNYPIDPPEFYAVGPIYNPAFFQDGRFGSFQPEIRLRLLDYLENIFYILEYQENFMHFKPSDVPAMDWYIQNRDNPALFPSDDKLFGYPELKDDFEITPSADAIAKTESDQTLQAENHDADDGEEILSTMELFRE